MDLRRLGLFLAVIDHGGFTAAARAVHVAQPAISLAVRELEAELGTQLVVRARTGAVATPAGEALVGPARQALRDVQIAAAAVAAVSGLVAGRIEIVSLPSLAADPLAPIVGRFRRDHPAVEVHLLAATDPDDLADQVRSGHAELGVTVAGSRGTTLVEQPLTDQELVAVCPPGSRHAGRRLSLSSLAKTPLVLTPEGTSLRSQIDAALTDASIQAAIAVETTQRDALVPLVIAGAGTTFVPRSLAAGAAALGAVVRPTRPILRRSIVLAHRPGELSPAALHFIDTCPK
ncbi:MAG: LysR family transcriptional regulator [Acidimicrobiia bacterium]